MGLKLLSTQTDETTLLLFGEEARTLLINHDFSGLAARFGYALAYERAPSTALEVDFLCAATSPLPAISTKNTPVSVKYFAPNEIGLFALIECLVPVTQDASVLIELIVAGKGEEKHITVEGISGA